MVLFLCLLFPYYSLSALYQDSLVSCSVFISISEVMIGECADLLGQDLLRGLRGVDGWQGDVKDQFTHQGRKVAVTFLPQEAGELGALCDGDWHSLSMVFFGRDVANDDKAVRAHLSLVSCSVFISISEVMIGECADLLG